MSQMLLIPDPRPLVERLGVEFFRQVPESPGVYLMRDAADMVLYVGKAKNLRKRLGCYRVANPDRMPRRHLRLLRAVTRIEIQQCPDEAAALVREAELLRSLRPRFNRAGTWPGPARFFAWRAIEAGLELAVREANIPGWMSHGPLGTTALVLRTVLVRLLWCALYPERGVTGMPEGWFHGRHGEVTVVPCPPAEQDALQETVVQLQGLFGGQVDEFVAWILERTSGQKHVFETAVREGDLETVVEYAQRHC